LQKQQEIDRLREENARRNDRLRYEERTAREGAFGSSTPLLEHPHQTQRRTDRRPLRRGAARGRRRTVSPQLVFIAFIGSMEVGLCSN
jgi:hypothetical protein